MKGFAMIWISMNKTAPGWAEGILKWRSRRARERGNRGEGIFAELQQKREVSFFKNFFSIVHIKLNLVMGMVGLPGPPKFLLQCLDLKTPHSKLLDSWTGKLLMSLFLLKPSLFPATTEKTCHSTLSRHLDCYYKLLNNYWILSNIFIFILSLLFKH